MAPLYGILFMGKLEAELLEFHIKSTIFLRYIDDLLMVFDHGEEDLKKFIDHINTYHPTIKFTHEFLHKTINFLDVQITKEDDGTLSTDLYVKPTNVHSYLHFTSCHPPHTLKSLPYSQAIRICHIYTNSTMRDKLLSEMKEYFLDRNYPAALIDNSIMRSINNHR